MPKQKGRSEDKKTVMDTCFWLSSRYQHDNCPVLSPADKELRLIQKKVHIYELDNMHNLNKNEVNGTIESGQNRGHLR